MFLKYLTKFHQEAKIQDVHALCVKVLYYLFLVSWKTKVEMDVDTYRFINQFINAIDKINYPEIEIGFFNNEKLILFIL